MIPTSVGLESLPAVPSGVANVILMIYAYRTELYGNIGGNIRFHNISLSFPTISIRKA